MLVATEFPSWVTVTVSIGVGTLSFTMVEATDQHQNPPREDPHEGKSRSTSDTLLEMFEDMKHRLLSVEMLWARLKQLEFRLQSVETTQVKLNARISGISKRRTYRSEDADEQVTPRLSGADAVGVAEEAVKRLHSAQKFSVQQPAQQTTTSQTSPEQYQES